MIFENRAVQPPSTEVVALRDQLEEATAQARANRGTGKPVAGAASTAPVVVTAPAASVPAPTATNASAPVVPVEDAPARTETLPPSP
jgi:hypothetical protein